MSMVPSPSTPLVFTFPETAQHVRSFITENGPEWVAADVCAVLEHSNPTMAVATLDEDEKGLRIIETPGGPQQMVTVNEPGLYSLILRSRKPQAKAFKRWITHKVLPAIRETGRYDEAPVPNAFPDVSSPAGVLALAEQFVVTARQLVEADERIAELEPKALIADRFLTAQKGDRLVRQVAKELGWREKDLRRFLLDEKLIFARERACDSAIEYDFYASQAGKFHSVEHPVEHRFGPCNHYTLYVTPLGMDLIQRRIARQQAAIRASIEGGLS